VQVFAFVQPHGELYTDVCQVGQAKQQDMVWLVEEVNNPGM